LSFALANLKIAIQNRINLKKLNFAIDKKKRNFQEMRFLKMI